jgi:hypothetical protein
MISVIIFGMVRIEIVQIRVRASWIKSARLRLNCKKLPALESLSAGFCFSVFFFYFVC